jgi:hypothetical protein
MHDMMIQRNAHAMLPGAWGAGDSHSIAPDQDPPPPREQRRAKPEAAVPTQARSGAAASQAWVTASVSFPKLSRLRPPPRHVTSMSLPFHFYAIGRYTFLRGTSTAHEKYSLNGMTGQPSDCTKTHTGSVLLLYPFCLCHTQPNTTLSKK